MARENEGPEFVRLFGPVLDALRQLGGSARPAEVEALVAEMLEIPRDVQEEQLESGGSRFRNRVHWARFYLAKAGLIDSSRRGVWSLTESGMACHPDHAESMEIFKSVHSQFGGARREASDRGSTTQHDATADVDDATDPEVSDHRVSLLRLLKSLPPEGFERICQRLLRESGFQKVAVTKRSGDGGLDGHGILQVNPLVSFYVYFQSKRWDGSVGAAVVRDFRGAMMGRADKGIILTTGTFIPEAKKEAVRDGVPPIELVDGETLVSMFENLELGLSPKTVYDIDESFFEEFGYQAGKQA